MAVELDHLILWGDVEMLASDVSGALGLDPVDGGTHPGRGTCNVLFAVEGDRFLEVLGPDREQAGGVVGPMDGHPHGTLWWWAARSDEPLDEARGRLADLGVEVGPVERGARIRPDGERLEWETFDPMPEPYVPALPFMIRWKDGPPLRGRSPAGSIGSFALCHPEPQALSAIVGSLGLDDASVRVERAEAPGLRATVVGPAGTLELATPALASP